MDSSQIQNAFETENARNELPENLPVNFVWTQNFTRLLNRKNHVVLGSRGSGKTALIKMLAHNYLSRSDDDRAKKIIKKKSVIGCYVPMRLEWVGAILNKSWFSDDEVKRLFQWRLNITVCLSFINTLESCVRAYSGETGEDPVLLEKKICSDVARDLLNSEKCYSFTKLSQLMEDVEFAKQQSMLSSKYGHSSPSSDTIGLVFDMALFQPLKRMRGILKRYIAFPNDASWLICLDEAEFLDARFQKIINSYMRTDSGDLFFKITTMPYRHYTLDTEMPVPLKNGDDFEYIYIDASHDLKRRRRKDIAKTQASEAGSTAEFIDRLLKNRLRKSGVGFDVNIEHLLGESELLDSSPNRMLDYWSDKGSPIYGLLEAFANPATKRRAKQLFGTKAFYDQIARKMTGALVLRSAVLNSAGARKLDIYSGYSMLIRCSDGNPRRAIHLFRRMLESSPEAIGMAGIKPIEPAAQNAVFEQYAALTLEKARPEYIEGRSIHEFIRSIGQALKSKLHDEEIGTDQHGCVELSSADKALWPLVREAVGLGYLYPVVNSSNPDELPIGDGVYRFSFVLAPGFYLLPRKGKSIRISAIFDRDK